MGEIRRLSYEELDPKLRDVLHAKVERLGYLGEFFAVAGRQPEATRAFQEFTEALKAALRPELTEVVALCVASTLGNAYEQTQHEQLSSKLGFSPEWIAAAVGRGDPSVLSEESRTARALAASVVDGYGRGAASELAGAVDVLGEDTAVGVLLTVGRYVAHAVVANTLELQAPVPSVLPVAAP
ncbi:MAG: carboxymuconolactone decarboxylase family protein [Acidimicrobiales bacterium]